MNFAVIDIETTGGNYNEEGITEIAIHKFDGIGVVDSFISLVNPEKEIQPFVAQLTGINQKMLKNAPKFYEVAKRIIEIIDDTVLVAHNASFDYRVLRNQFEELGYDLDIPCLCTVELSKKLLPEMASYSLGKLCRSLGIPVSDRHRANGDALAALKLFQLLLQKDQDKLIVKASIKNGNKRDLSDRLLKILDELPEKTGVFYFHRYNGDIIYTGKGRNIKKQVNQLFLMKTPAHRSMVKKMNSVSFDLTGSQLISLLKFEETLAEHRPVFNKRSSIQQNGKINFNHNDFVLVDKGRYPDEKSVVLIQNNQYMGYGYTELNHQLNDLNVLRRLITAAPPSMAYKYLIKKYLKTNEVEKIIRY